MRNAKLYALLNVIAKVSMTVAIAGWLGMVLALVTK